LEERLASLALSGWWWRVERRRRKEEAGELAAAARHRRYGFGAMEAWVRYVVSRREKRAGKAAAGRCRCRALTRHGLAVWCAWLDGHCARRVRLEGAIDMHRLRLVREGASAWVAEGLRRREARQAAAGEAHAAAAAAALRRVEKYARRWRHQALGARRRPTSPYHLPTEFPPHHRLPPPPWQHHHQQQHSASVHKHQHQHQQHHSAPVYQQHQQHQFQTTCDDGLQSMGAAEAVAAVRPTASVGRRPAGTPPASAEGPAAVEWAGTRGGTASPSTAAMAASAVIGGGSSGAEWAMAAARVGPRTRAPPRRHSYHAAPLPVPTPPAERPLAPPPTTPASPADAHAVLGQVPRSASAPAEPPLGRRLNPGAPAFVVAAATSPSSGDSTAVRIMRSELNNRGGGSGGKGKGSGAMSEGDGECWYECESGEAEAVSAASPLPPLPPLPHACAAAAAAAGKQPGGTPPSVSSSRLPRRSASDAYSVSGSVSGTSLTPEQLEEFEGTIEEYEALRAESVRLTREASSLAVGASGGPGGSGVGGGEAAGPGLGGAASALAARRRVLVAAAAHLKAQRRELLPAVRAAAAALGDARDDLASVVSSALCGGGGGGAKEVR